MNLQDFLKIFMQECEKNNIEYYENKTEKLFEYMVAILEWNEKVNVTAIKDEEQFIVKHLIDSLMVGTYIKDCQKILDIGTGAGVPGVPLKIYFPDKEFTLIDSVNKKINVVKDVIQKLELNNIEALHVRAEELAQNLNYRERFDCVITRAVSSLPTISEYMLPFVKMGGKAICMKGPNIEQELKDAEKAILILGGKIEKIENFVIDEELERNLIILKKIKMTDKKYPRGQGKPVKEPIR